MKTELYCADRISKCRAMLLISCIGEEKREKANKKEMADGGNVRIMREEKKKHEKEEKKKIEAFYRVQLFFQNKRRGYPVALSDSMSALFFFLPHLTSKRKR